MTSVAIVGSGPSGIACAKALVRRGVKPVVLDAGERLDPDRQRMIDRMRDASPADWAADDIRRATENPTAKSGSIPLKLAFGSDYVYGRGRAHSPYDAAGVGLWPTFGQGGYSTVWGAAIQPAHDDDLEAWPIKRADLEDGYRAVLNFAPLASEPSALDDEFALPGSAASLVGTPQGRQLLARLNAKADVLRSMSVLHGRSRLMVRATDSDTGLGCVSCGLCLSGCPKGAIWSATDELGRMNRAGEVEYRSPIVVRRLSEQGKSVQIESDQGVVSFDRVFVAAGALSSTRIMLETLGHFGAEIRLKNSQKILVPVLTTWAGQGAMSAKVPTLASVFLEARVPEIGRHWMHVQISAVNSLVLDRLGIDPTNPGWRGFMFRPLVERLMICWAGLHSDHSAEIALSLGKSNDGPSVLTARPRPHSAERRNFAMAARVLRQALREAGAHALTPAATIAEPGNGGHFGGSFPMSRASLSRFASDVLGRPSGFERVHLVDSSVLPTIPATPPTLSVMANAWRIAQAAPL